MEIWKEFEKQCVDYLNSSFGEFANFAWQGGSDSKKEDIFVRTKNKKEFYIEAKHSPAQCGQFVLLPNTKTHRFEYSSQNVTALNDESLKIIDFMNENFEAFRDAGTAGKEIIFNNCNAIFSKWIIDFYKSKGAKYVITNNFTILPIDDFPKFFDISAKYRIKRSGSSPVGNKNLEVIKNYIIDNFAPLEVITNNNKLFIKSNQNLHNKRFIFNGYEYMLSEREDVFEVRKLSKTFNANVIFSVVLKKDIQGLSASNFATLLLS